MDSEQLSRGYDLWILVRRWAATWLDNLFFVLVAALLVPLARIEIAAALGVGVLFTLLYYPLAEGLAGKTVGKLLCGLSVVDAQGSRPGIGKALIRTLWRLIEINPLLVGGVPAGVAVWTSKTRQRLGDASAKTYVIGDEDRPGQRGRGRLWPLPGALLTTLAAIGLFTFSGISSKQASQQKPTPISFETLLKTPPKDGYFRVTDCYIDVSNAIYEIGAPDSVFPGVISQAYIPILPEESTDKTKTKALLSTDDKSTLEMLNAFEKFDKEKASEKTITDFSKKNAEKIIQNRDITGMISEGPLVVTLQGDAFQEMERTRLSESYSVLKEGETPGSNEAIVAGLGGGFICLIALIFWVLLLVVASTPARYTEGQP